MVDHAHLQSALSEFVRALGGRYEIGRVLYELSDHSVAVLGCDGAGVAVRDQQGELAFVTATDASITRIEETQIEAGQGPCHEAFTSGGQVMCPDLEAESRWPAYREVARREGIRTVVGFPLRVRDEAVGALNVYWRTRCEPDADIREVGQLLAAMAAAYIANQVVLSNAERLNKQLQEALDSRVVIEQAKGVIGERHDVDPGEAFSMLRGYARANRRRLHQVAREVVAGDLRL